MKQFHREKGYATTRIIIFQDTAFSTFGSLLSILMVRWISDPIPDFTTMVLIWLGVAAVMSVAAFVLTGSARAIRRYASYRTLSRLLPAILIKEAALTFLPVLGVVSFPSPALAVTAIVIDVLATAVLLVYPRYASTVLRREERNLSAMAGKKNTLVLGTDDESVALAESAERTGHFQVLGFLTYDRAMSGRVIGDHIVYFCEDQSELGRLQWRLGGIDCILIPKGSGSGAATDVVQADGMKRVGHVVKRTVDMLLSGVLLLVFSPLLLFCAIAVKIEDGGPVIYAQERIGRNGKPFLIYKFRSMRMDAEKGGPALYGGDSDPRLTRVGRFLRQHHLDEIPQLWNVFKGDMSFIGYRPERPYYIDRIMECNPRYRYLYQIRPGVTSYATLYNGYTDTLDKMLTRLDLDLYYLRNHSLWFDAKVLGITFLRIVTGKKF